MIEINLLPGSGKKARSDGFSLKAFAGQAGARVKDPFMIAAAVCIVAATVSIGYLHVSQTAKADELTERERRAVQDSTRYVAVLRERNRALRRGAARPPAPPPPPRLGAAPARGHQEHRQRSLHLGAHHG
jgi:hypothetical protein